MQLFTLQEHFETPFEVTLSQGWFEDLEIRDSAAGKFRVLSAQKRGYPGLLRGFSLTYPRRVLVTVELLRVDNPSPAEGLRALVMREISSCTWESREDIDDIRAAVTAADSALAILRVLTDTG